MDVEDVWEWAWRQYQASARSFPDCEHNKRWNAFNKECRKIQLVMLRLQDGKADEGTMTVATAKKQKPPKQTVVAVSEMTEEVFSKHFNHRHGDSIKMEYLPEDMDFNIWQLYIAFHFRLHNTRVDFDHEHEPDAPEVAVDKAIECLIENRNWGWKELAGITGHIAVFPDGQIATRINGAVQHHKTIEEATDRLIKTNSHK